MPMELTYLLAAESPTVTANPLFPSIPWFTNSVLVTIIVTILVVIWARRSTAKMTLMPDRIQNLFEALVETLYITFEGIVGKHMIPKVFPLIATQFIFILTANWFGLIPGVGTIWFENRGQAEDSTSVAARQRRSQHDAGHGSILHGLVAVLDHSGGRGDRVSEGELRAEGRSERGSLCRFVAALRFRRGHRDGLDRHPPCFALLPVVWKYVRWRDAVAHDVGPERQSAIPAELDLFNPVSASVLLPRAVGGLTPSFRFCDALRCLHQALN